MNTQALLVGGAVVVAAGGVWLLSRSRQKALEAQKAAPPAAGPTVAAVPPLPPEKKAEGLASGGLKVPKELGLAGTVTAGIKLQETLGRVADAVGGEGTGDVARVAPMGLGVAAIGGKALQRGLEAAGVPKEPARQIGVIAGAGLVLGAPAVVGVASAQLLGNGLQAGLKAIAGERVERAVSNAVSQLDPFKKGSAANAVISPVAKGVTAVAGLLGLGGKPKYKGPSKEDLERVEAFTATLQAGGPARSMGGVTASRTANGAVQINAINLPFFRKK